MYCLMGRCHPTGAQRNTERQLLLSLSLLHSSDHVKLSAHDMSFKTSESLNRSHYTPLISCNHLFHDVGVYTLHDISTQMSAPYPQVPLSHKNKHESCPSHDFSVFCSETRAWFLFAVNYARWLLRISCSHLLRRLCTSSEINATHLFGVIRAQVVEVVLLHVFRC